MLGARISLKYNPKFDREVKAGSWAKFEKIQNLWYNIITKWERALPQCNRGTEALPQAGSHRPSSSDASIFLERTSKFDKQGKDDK